MSTFRCMVQYRDKRGEVARYFGPFVSRSIAEFFQACLPEPLDGGVCQILTLQPFTQADGHIVAQKILEERVKSANYILHSEE